MNQDNFWEKVKINLQAGKVRLVIATDGIPDNLKRIIEFLNKQMDPAEFIGIDLRKFCKDDLEVYESSVIGNTAETKAKKGVARRTRSWDMDTFLADMETRSGPEARRITQYLVDWCNSHNVRIIYGGGLTEGSIITVYDKGRSDNILFGLYGGGKFYFQFQYLRPPFNTDKWRETIRTYFNDVLHKPLTVEDMKKRPSLFITDFDDEFRRRLLSKFELFIQDAEMHQNQCEVN